MRMQEGQEGQGAGCSRCLAAQRDAQTRALGTGLAEMSLPSLK